MFADIHEGLALYEAKLREFINRCEKLARSTEPFSERKNLEFIATLSDARVLQGMQMALGLNDEEVRQRLGNTDTYAVDALLNPSRAPFT